MNEFLVLAEKRSELEGEKDFMIESLSSVSRGWTKKGDLGEPIGI